ncbi:lysylphosphatidylglycerol synthase domain-containing protein [Azospirillum sp. B4]|uniref:lysylphosphatidylglycerol synthase domain-containing protein n=1 Tax=Azospirillum sp. B4 TaxID=95605 RepID=UPI00034C1F97|nr:lysylphosphatidylglycerol synthase domain-containing protein [Azospirillum sp. B4]
MSPERSPDQRPNRPAYHHPVVIDPAARAAAGKGRGADTGPGGAGSAGATADAAPKPNWKKRLITLVTALVLVGLVVLAVRHVARDFHPAEVWAYVRLLPWMKVAQAAGLVASAYLVMTLYDVSALKYLGIKLPYRTVGFGSFAGYAISNNVGFAVISGGSVRYRVYSVAGLSASDIAKIVVFSTTTFTLGITFTGALGVAIGPEVGAGLLNVPAWLLQGIAALVLVGLGAMTVAAAATHKPVRLWRWSFALPSSGVMLSQIIIASMEILLSAAALWTLLPPEMAVGFMEFTGLFCAGLAIPIVSHVPGGLGVFQTILLLGLRDHGPAGGAIGALLAYRFLYYVLPLVCAGVLLLIWEIRADHGPVAAWRRWRARRGR